MTMGEEMYYLLGTIAILLIGLTYLAIKLSLIKRDLRKMREELQKTQEEDYNRELRMSLIDPDLEKLAAQINQNLEHQKQLKLQAGQSRKQLERSISDIAHDLRTPLTVVKGNLQMLENESLSEQGKEYLKVSGRKAETLKRMVDEFFELSVLESDDKPITLSKISILDFLSEFIIENETLIRSHELTPQIQFPEKAIYVQANPEMLARVFSNLMGNIFKYAKNSFTLCVTQDGELCRIRMGNQVERSETIDVNHIFDRTYRADKARSDGSAGLGLYIARLLMTKQKGSITAVQEGDKLYFDLTLATNS